MKPSIQAREAARDLHYRLIEEWDMGFGPGSVSSNMLRDGIVQHFSSFEAACTADLRALVVRLAACLESAVVAQAQLKELARVTGIGWAIMDCENEIRAALAAIPAELREKGEKT